MLGETSDYADAEEYCPAARPLLSAGRDALRPRWQAAGSDLRDLGFALVGNELFQLSDADLSVLDRVYDEELELDAYLPETDRYRYRAYQAFTLSVNDMVFVPKDTPPPYFQSRSVNQVAGGVARRFKIIHSAHAVTPIAERLARVVAALLTESGALSVARCLVDLHYVRIIAPGKPVPEGVHRDGLIAGSCHLIRRVNVVGAESAVYDDSQRMIRHFELRNPLDTLVFDDDRVMHYTAPIALQDSVRPGYRDALLIGFRAEPSS